MAFTNAILLKAPKLKTATTIYNVGTGKVFTNTMLLKVPKIRTATTYVSSGNISLSPARLLKVLKARACVTIPNIVAPSLRGGNFYKTILLKTGVVSYRETASAHFTQSAKLIFTYTGLKDVNDFPYVGLSTVLEILYPVGPIPVLSREAHQTDDKQYKTIVKPSGDKIFSLLKFRIKDSYLVTFLSFLKTNQGLPVNLYTPSLYPFGNNYVRSRAYIVTYSKPQLEKSQYWRMDITFLQILGLA